MATVTDKHLEIARTVAFQRGVLDFGSIEARRLFAQALADLEAETAHRCWCEGYEACDDDTARVAGDLPFVKQSPCPYPEPTT